MAFSPFFLVYGSEAILPTDVAFGAPRIQFYEEGEAEQTRCVNLNSLEEQRLAAVMRQARHEQQLRRYHDRNVKETSSTLATSSSSASRRPMACTSSLPLGRDPSLSTKLSAHPLITSNGATDKEYQTLGTWSTYNDSIRRIAFKNSSYVFPFLVLFKIE
jgi:hypothetical protein